MMKIWNPALLWATMLLLLAILAGCSGAGQAGEGAPLTRLDSAAWPTGAPPTVPPTATPFPKVAQRPATALPTATTTAPAPKQAGASNPAAPTALPVLAGQVKTDGLNVRQGPGTGYLPIAALRAGDRVTITAASTAGDWLRIIIAGGKPGWVAGQFIAPEGEVSSLPKVMAPPPATSGTDVPAPAAPAAPAAAAGAPSPAAARGSGPGRLVFQLSSGGDIMISDGLGTPHRLTAGMDPTLSPDGKIVAFTRWMGETGSLWTINVDGSNERQVISGLKQARGPDWAPDAGRIVVNYQHEGRLLPERVCKPYEKGDPGIPWNAGDIGVSVGGVNIVDGKPVPEIDLCWTLPPDPHWGLSVVDVATGKADDLYGGMYAFRPSWDPTQPWRIVSEAGNGLLETSVNRDHQQYLTKNVGDKAPVISPDGRYLAVTFNNNGRWDIYRMNSDGSGRVRLTDMPVWTQVGPDRQAPWNNVSPAWSPDGSQIAFLTDRAGRWEVWAMNADGSNQHPLFSAEINAGLSFKYDFNDEKVLNWR